MPLQYTEHIAIFARYLINEISLILHQYRRNHYFITMIIKKSLLSIGIPQSYPSLIIPTSMIDTTSCIYHFSVFTVVCHHVDSTVRFGWCFEEAVPLRFSQSNDSLFYGHTLITNSSTMVSEESTETDKLCISNCYVKLSHIIWIVMNQVFIELQRRIL